PLASRVQKRVRGPIRRATQRAVALLSSQFVHGATIEQSVIRARKSPQGLAQHSFDMLGEAALTGDDAQRFFDDYRHAISSLVSHCNHDDFRQNPGISIKLSALHPRYEFAQSERVIKELGDRVLALALQARNANMGLNIDAEEANRLELSLHVIERVLRHKELQGWDGFGIVVQAYGKAAPHVLDWLYTLADDLDRRIMVRLVKGAYWDMEIKRAQVEGLPDFPVYTRKAATDVAYLCCARKLLGMTDRIYPQFAGHNAHTIVSIMAFADQADTFEFQRIHGMGEPVHELLQNEHGHICRIYAPVGSPNELLPYLARRILENGANSSFVNQIADVSQDAASITRDPFATLDAIRKTNDHPIDKPVHLFGAGRLNAQGWDIQNPFRVAHINRAREPFANHSWDMAESTPCTGPLHFSTNPYRPEETVGRIRLASMEDVDAAYGQACPWHETTPAPERARILLKVSEQLEQDAGEFFALLAREAGKTLDDATAELREGVDFLRYYAAECVRLADRKPLGIVACISPWNFPLAIFVGQCSAALAAGNAVLAKPAEQTPLIAGTAIQCFHRCGVPPTALQLLPGSGHGTGQALVSHPRVAGVAFTGSTETARQINRSLANSDMPAPRMVAETGGLNAMIVDSTALPEQAIRDIIVSAFRSAGQRCSALRLLYLQEEVADAFLAMLYGAIRELTLSDPWALSTDIGPLIDNEAAQEITAYVNNARAAGRLL
ncbi:MAG: bifunctional proline dehydrogenase/L-glutamate gamma-semialdehyde dehydrogenase PutA, partial [Rhodobacteraceae bacterium]|nr:bifunctional proline dehydrogenase/L-glutamate gamma-semialdehyde dehydrogenase PutA [Paracoccaceae bacterium]